MNLEQSYLSTVISINIHMKLIYCKFDIERPVDFTFEQEIEHS